MAFSVFMLLIAENIPATSETVPLIGIYLTVTMSLTSLSIILTVLVLQLHYTGSFAPDVSENLYRFMTRTIASRIGMSNTVKRYEAKRNLILKKRQKCAMPNNYESSKTEKLSQIETSLVDCRKNINAIKNDLKYLSENQSSFKKGRNLYSNMSQRALKRTKSKQVPNDHASRIVLLDETLVKNIEIKKENNINNECGINLKIETDTSSKRLPINDLSQYYNNGIYEIKQVNGHVNNNDYVFCNKNTNNSKTNYQIDDCVKKIDIFSNNLQRYLDLHEMEEINNYKKNEWKLIASIIDRFLFWIFLVITFISTIMLLIVIPYLKNNYFFSIFQNLRYLKKSS